MAIWFVGGGVALALLISAPPGGGDAPLLDISESFVASVASNLFLKGCRPKPNKCKLYAPSSRPAARAYECFFTALAPSYVYSHLCVEKGYFLSV